MGIQKRSTMKITKKQESFCVSIATGEFDYSWQAYEAHYNTSNMSQNTIYQESCRLLANPKIATRISELREDNKGLIQASLEEVINEMTTWLQFDPIEMFDENDALLGIHKLPEGVRKSIASFEVQEIWEWVDKEKIKVGELKKVKLVDKRATADMHLKKLGAYITNLNVKTDSLEHLTDLLKGIEE